MRRLIFAAIILMTISQAPLMAYGYIEDHYDRLNNMKKERQREEELYLMREQVRIQSWMLDEQRILAPRTPIRLGGW